MKTKTYAEQDSRAIAIRFKKAQIAKIQTTARKLSAEKDKDITYVDLIREAVDKVYPLNE